VLATLLGALGLCDCDCAQARMRPRAVAWEVLSRTDCDLRHFGSLPIDSNLYLMVNRDESCC
jgi:hypothetical protein